MKGRNMYDFHSVYLKSQIRESENWERIEGVFDAQARLSQSPIKGVSLKRSKKKLLGMVSNSNDRIPGAVRRIVRFFNHQK
jgi:hypothetical protein